MKSRAGALDIVFIVVGLALALTVAAMLASQVGQITGSEQIAFFIVGVIIVPLASALISYQIAKRVRAPGKAGLWALLGFVLPAAGLVLTAVLGITLRRIIAGIRG